MNSMSITDITPPIHFNVSTTMETYHRQGSSSSSPTSLTTIIDQKPVKSTRTCDNCRKRKIKCIEDLGGLPCDGCRKLGLECKHDYVKKKPGRKNSFAVHAMKARDSQGSDSMSDQSNSYGNGNGNGHNHGHGYGYGQGHGQGDQSRVQRNGPSYNHNYSPYAYPPIDPTMRSTSNSTSTMHPPPNHPQSQPQSQRHQSQHISPSLMFTHADTTQSDPNSSTYPTPSGSNLPQAPTPGRPTSSFAFSPSTFKTQGEFSWLDSILEGNGNNNGAGDFLGDSSSLFTTQYPSEQAHLLSLESPEHMLASGSTFGIGAIGGPGAMLPPMRREPQLEDVTSWANISHYISLFLQYLYPLLPLVHRPTFAEHLATRRDLRDTDFRALLLSIVTYVISQLPTSRLVNEQFDIEGLKHLQRRCHRTCKVLQRTYYGPTNLTQVTTIVFDTFYLLSIGLGHTAASRLGQACQLAFSMGMHDDTKTETLGLDAIEVQLRRRVFWQLYVSDKTRAIPGPPMLINDFQGVCSLPEPVDDDFITSQGMFPQPASRVSVLAGFVAIAREFQIISECFFHHRYIINTGSKMISTSWTVEAEDKLHRLLRDLPTAIQDPMTNSTEAAKQSFAMQRANILITAAIAKFALYDLRSSLDVEEESLAREREAIAREIHGLLMNIPVEDLASNGESVRGKVFHIACALCVQAPNAGDTDLVRDWCNMFSTISFLQMPPPPPEAAVDSRAGTPPGEVGTASSLMSAPTNRST